MISYTVTTQKTQGEYSSSATGSTATTFLTLQGPVPPGTPHATYVTKDLGFDYSNYGSATQKSTRVAFTASDGGSSFSIKQENTWTAMSEAVDGKFSEESFYSESETIDSNLAATRTFSFSYKGTYGDNDQGADAGGEETYTTLTPTTEQVQTTTVTEWFRYVQTTTVGGDVIAVGITTIIESKTVPTTTFSQITATIGTAFIDTGTTTRVTTAQIDTSFKTYDGGIQYPPRDTATVFCQMQNASVWIPSATGLSGAGPWVLTDIASSQTSDFTALPFYSTTPLFVTDESLNTLPDLILTTVTEAYTTLTYDTENPVIRTIWRSNSSGFPLESYTQVRGKYTTTAVENIFEIEKESQVNQALTEAATEIGTQLSVSAAGKNFGMTYQDIFSHSYTTTRYRGIYSFTSSTQYEGLSVDTEAIDGTTKSTFYQNVSVNFAEGMTVVGTNFEQIVIRNFSPCVVSHVETSFADAWGIYASNAPQPKNQISFAGDLSLQRSDFAELLPGVSVPFPTNYSWSTGNSTFSASLAGNGITVTTSSGTGSAASSSSETYEFQGDGTAHTEQIVGRDFFVNSRGLPPISFFGPHAATGSVETRALPGEYVSITQDSLGDFTLSTLTHESSASSTLSTNAILFPAEKSFYISKVDRFGYSTGSPFLTFSRNPIP
jgi:hypothetical protein